MNETSPRNQPSTTHTRETLVDPYLKLGAAASSNNTLPRWMLDYIEFHQSSIIVEGNRAHLKEGVPYIVYDCYGTCAGLGGRVKGMIKSLYAAMCSGRVFLIDSPFPFPLQEFLKPHHIRWDAAFPKTAQRVPVFTTYPPRTRRLNIPSNITGFVIDVAFGPEMWDIGFIRDSYCMHDMTRVHQYDRIQDGEETLLRYGFHTLFRFDDKVVARAEELKHDAGLPLLHGVTVPYLGIHVRTGDGPTWKDPRRHRGKKAYERFLRCSQIFAREKGLVAGYIASDSQKAKEYLSQREPQFSFAKNMEVFHIDKSMTASWATNFTALKEYGSVADEAIARRGMLDVFAELKVLADSSCIVLSKSGLSYAAQYIGGAPRCGIYIDCCDQDEFRQGNYSYAQRKTRLVPRPLP